eukprot:TRINITY_DN6627_c0_g1_i1.p1 TRINITY_DN6627_c0_g1~~TRINITY_DN6627_c0_g1_i1.p1  ORF type:complete len:436 (-),score=102.26 TRINITY_DN6627_c0_g1_i1:24-1307(-)
MSNKDSWTYPKDLLQKIPPKHYIHVLNNNTNVIRVEIGPNTLLLKDEEHTVYGPQKMVVVPPGHFVTIDNPVVTTTTHDGQKIAVYDPKNQVKLRHGAKEVRLSQPPFPLYPGERIDGRIEKLSIVEEDCALKLLATSDILDTESFDEDGEPIFRRAGSEWLFYGPGTYIPHADVRVVNKINSIVITPGEALSLTAKIAFTDSAGKYRRAGENWLITEEGAYLPALEEQIGELIDGHILTDRSAIHVRAIHQFYDEKFEVERKPGEQWLVTNETTELFIPDVHEHIVRSVGITTLNRRQWTSVLNPVENGKPQFGKLVLVKGETNFFAHPGEVVSTINDVIVLTADAALKIMALETFIDETGVQRTAGQQWLVFGPKEYWPPLEASVQQHLVPIFNVGEYPVFRLDRLVMLASALFLVLVILIYKSY